MKMMEETFGIDKNSEENGVIVDYGNFSVTIKHAYRTNMPYVKMFDKEMEPVRRAFENNLLSDEKSNDILHKVYAHTIVIDWAGMKSDDGKEIKYSPDKCVALFKKYPKFFDAIKKESENFALFKTASIKGDEKNS